MTAFKHSVVLFSGDDGLPLEFNIRHIKEKQLVRAMIEHGGGLCSQSDTSVHLISPGTRVLNADLGKKLVSTRYIFDCIEENYLLDVDDYVYTVNEATQNSISDDDSNDISALSSTKSSKSSRLVNLSFFSPSKSRTVKTKNKKHSPKIESTISNCLDTLKDGFNFKFQPHMANIESESSSSESELQSQNIFSSPSKSFSFHKEKPIQNVSTELVKDGLNLAIESFIENSSVDFNPEAKAQAGCSIPWTSTAKDILGNQAEISVSSRSENNIDNPECSNAQLYEPSYSAMNNMTESNCTSNDRSDNPSPNLGYRANLDVQEEEMVGRGDSPSPVLVSSSQPEADEKDLDPFDRMILSKAESNTQPKEDVLSQSYTVSSSADAQVSSKPNSNEMFPPAAITVSSSQETSYIHTFDPQKYITNLESQMKEVLQNKSSPVSIQDKITLVKYICSVEKLHPSEVLNRFASF